MGLLDTTDTEPKLNTKSPWNESCSWRQDGFVLVAEIEADEGCDPDHMGVAYGDKETATDCADEAFRGTPFPPYVRELRTRSGPAWFVPEVSNYKGATPEEAATYFEQDYDRIAAYYLEEWSYMKVTVTAYQGGRGLGDDTLHGVESDAGDYFLEAIDQCAAEAMHKAKAARVDITVGEDPWHNDTVQFARIMSELNAGGYGLDYEALGTKVGLTELEVSQVFRRADEVWDAAEKKMCESVVARCGVTA